MEYTAYSPRALTIPPGISGIKHYKGRLRINNPSHSRPIAIFFLIFSAISIAAVFSIGIDWVKIYERTSNLTRVITALAELDFSDIDIVIPAFFESIWVAVLGTIYSLFLGLFFSIFMSRNLTPFKWLPQIFSSFFTFVRAVPTAVWVLLCLVCLGFGPAPGIVGLCIASTAFFSRAFAQCFEEVPQETIEALVSIGANKIKIFFSAVLPSALTSVIAWTAMNFELNFAASSILGMVGAGGIGYVISQSFRAYKYDRAMVAIILVFLVSYLLELSFTSLKRKLKV